MIIVMGGNKASSKSTLVQNLIVLLSQHFKVAAVDADVQGSLIKWDKRRVDGGFEKNYSLYTEYGNIAETLINLNNEYDLVFVDVKGTNSKELITAGSVADLILVPLESTIKLIETLDELVVQQNLIKNKNIYLIYTKAETNPTISGERAYYFNSQCSKYPQFKILESVISSRRSFYKTDEEGLTVIEYKDEKAKNELENLAKEIIKLCNEV